ncbi:MAG: SDR family NAD(P)-dependent oxidoreductase [Pelagimonas sp.]|jgi:short-subunit dehydrogenase|nr:SDR family NAD(P)-dependent oxidoreductase [Pelagimonas sp.]
MKTAVITGGLGGLGQALDTALRAKGWQTVLVDLDSSALRQLRDRRIPQQIILPCDLTDPAALNRLCDQIRNRIKTIDLVIYNAGVTQIAAFADSDLSALRRVFEINTFAAISMAQALLPDLRASRGTHLAISSVAGFAPLIHRTSYAASKHAVQGFFASLRSEERPFGVQVSIAAPSFIATNPDARPDQQALSRPGAAKDAVDAMPADQAAQIILRDVEKGRAFIPVGRVARLSYLLNRLSPALYQRLMERKITAS